MKNLTEKQETIIADITNEFVKINQEKVTRKKGGLLDVDTLLFERDKDMEYRKEIDIENRIAMTIFFDAVKRDMDNLNEDLQHLKLYAHYCNDNKTTFSIDVIGMTKNDTSLRFEYTQDCRSINFKSGISSISKKLDKYKIIFYHGSNEHMNIESALKDEYAIRMLNNLINKAN